VLDTLSHDPRLERMFEQINRSLVRRRGETSVLN
jgi:hypothetical protein